MSIDEVFKSAGGVTKLARSLGLHHTTVMGWTAVPPKHVRRVSDLTGKPPHELRPDLWDAPAPEPVAPDSRAAAPGQEAA